MESKVMIYASDRSRAGSVVAYKSIPYARAPEGFLRWRQAEPVDYVEDDYATRGYSDSPMQLTLDDPNAFFYKRPFSVAENCLYLNIWTLNVKDNDESDGLKPVMVWIYGGGLLSGTANDPVLDGEELAKKGVVVVTFNYRLGVFGYFSHPALTEESENNSSGNYGLTDQIEALKWIKRHISKFGGDPENVTLFGESAGALSISQLMASSLSIGLFHKAILQSAYLPAMPALQERRLGMLSAEEYGLRFAESLGVYGKGKDALRGLRSIPAEDLLRASAGFEFDKAIIDGWVLQKQVYEAFELGEQHDIPIIAGFNGHEGSYFPLIGLVSTPNSPEEYIQTVQHKYGNLTDQYLSVYPSDDLYYAAYAPMGDGLYAWGTERLARSMCETATSRVYLYKFNHAPQWAHDSLVGAVHSLEIPYAFDNIKFPERLPAFWKGNLPDDKDMHMAAKLSQLWVDFARVGKPYSMKESSWPPFTIEDRSYISFSNGVGISTQHLPTDTFNLHEAIVNQRMKSDKDWTYKNIGLLADSINN